MSGDIEKSQGIILVVTKKFVTGISIVLQQIILLKFLQTYFITHKFDIVCLFFWVFFYLFRCPTSYERAQSTSLRH